MKESRKHENWELCPEHPHPVARTLLTEEFYWDCADDNSPLGNDAGANVLAFYHEAWQEDPELDPVEFLTGVLEDWDMPLDQWAMVDPRAVATQSKNEPHAVTSVDDAVIAIAFTMPIPQGWVDARIRDMARPAIRRESSVVVLEDRGWHSPEERLERLKNRADKIDRTPTA